MWSREPSQRIQEAQVRLTAVPYEMRLDEAGSLRDMRQGAQRASDEARGITVRVFKRKTRREAAERRLREEIRKAAMLCCCRGLLHAAQLRQRRRCGGKQLSSVCMILDALFLAPESRFLLFCGSRSRTRPCFRFMFAP